MSSTHLLLGDLARSKILTGASAIADAVRPTLGPRSKCVLLEQAWGSPLVCNDGVTIAKLVEPADPEERLGARMLREAAVRTGDAVGDGTTTSTLLAHAIYAEGLRNVVAGASAIEVKRGVDLAVAAVVAALRKLARPVASRQETVHVATISAHNDPPIGERVAEAMERVGAEGVVTLEDAKGTETSLEVVEGMRFDHGYLSPYFITSPQRLEAVLEHPLILLVDRKISTLADLLPLLEQVVRAARPLLVVAEDVEGEALATLVVNKLRATLSACAVKAPGYGDRRRESLRDLGVLTGGKVVTEDLGITTAKLTLEDLGSARRVVVDKETTTVVGGEGEKAALEARVAALRTELEAATSDYDKEKLRERLAKLAGGVAVIRVGAPSEAEMKNRKEAYEDALAATKAAVAEGIVPGGGLALVRCLAAADAVAATVDGDARTGVRVLARALETPARQIARNSGFDDGVVLERLRTATEDVGFDASRGVHVPLMAAGIIDPAKVVRVALENAASVAGVLLLTEATLTQVPEKGAKGRGGEEPDLP